MALGDRARFPPPLRRPHYNCTVPPPSFPPCHTARLVNLSQRAPCLRPPLILLIYPSHLVDLGNSWEVISSSLNMDANQTLGLKRGMTGFSVN
jgi:hypothetical protein